MPGYTGGGGQISGGSGGGDTIGSGGGNLDSLGGGSRGGGGTGVGIGSRGGGGTGGVAPTVSRQLSGASTASSEAVEAANSIRRRAQAQSLLNDSQGPLLGGVSGSLL